MLILSRGAIAPLFIMFYNSFFLKSVGRHRYAMIIFNDIEEEIIMLLFKLYYGEEGYYWSSESVGAYGAKCLKFSSSMVTSEGLNAFEYGASVRCVQE